MCILAWFLVSLTTSLQGVSLTDIYLNSSYFTRLSSVDVSWISSSSSTANSLDCPFVLFSNSSISRSTALTLFDSASSS